MNTTIDIIWRKRAHFFLSLLFLALISVAGGCRPAGQPGTGGPAEEPAVEQPVDRETVTGGRAYVESVEVRLLESFPVQAEIVIRGNLSDGCTTIAEIRQERTDSTFNLTIVTNRPADAVCTEALVPFAETISLDIHGLPAGAYTVSVDGQTATFSLATDNVMPEEPAEEPVAPEAGVVALTVVYDDGSLWLWQHGQEMRQLGESGNVNRLTISDDGQRIVYEREGVLWTVNADGSDERQLLEPAALASLTVEEGATVVPYRLGWMPASHTLLFNTQLEFEEGIGLNPSDDLHALDVDSGNHQLLLPPGEGGDFYVSPDGNQIALVTPSAIHVANADGSTRRQVLTYEPVITYSEYQYYANPVWGPDAGILRVAIPPADPMATPPQPTTIWQLHADGTPPQIVDHLEAVNTLFTTPAISPLGTHVAFLTGDEPDAYTLQIAPIEPTGLGEAHTYAAGIVQFDEWAPGGTHFIYSAGQLESPQKMLGALDMEPMQIGEPGRAIVQAQGASGGRVIFLQQADSGLELTLRHADGTVEVIADIGSDRRLPVFAYTR